MPAVRILAVVTPMLLGCGGQAPSPAPSAVVQPSPPPSRPPSLTGTVLQNDGSQRRPVAGAHVLIVDLVEGPYGNFSWFDVATTADGRFSAYPPEGRAVKVTAYAGSTSVLWNRSGLSQVCAVHPVVSPEIRVELELTAPGIRPSNWTSPVLSGVVYETISERRMPAADMPVLYSSYGHDGADVYTRTDSQGRYTFCALPFGAGYVLPACTRSETLPPGYRPTTFPVDIRGDTVLNVDCP